MSEKDFDKGYKSGYKLGKEVANEEWLGKVKGVREEIENEIKFWNEETTDPMLYTTKIRKAKANSYKHCLEIINNLMEESEEK